MEHYIEKITFLVWFSPSRQCLSTTFSLLLPISLWIVITLLRVWKTVIFKLSETDWLDLCILIANGGSIVFILPLRADYCFPLFTQDWWILYLTDFGFYFNPACNQLISLLFEHNEHLLLVSKFIFMNFWWLVLTSRLNQVIGLPGLFYAYIVERKQPTSSN